MISIKLIFRRLMSSTKEFFSNIFKTKKGIFAIIAYVIGILTCLCSTSLVVSNTGLSITETIAEQLFNDVRNDEKTIGIVYAHESFKETWELNIYRSADNRSPEQRPESFRVKFVLAADS